MTVGRLLDHVLVLLTTLGVALALLRHDARSTRARWAWRAGALAWALLWLSATPALSGALVRALETAPPAEAQVVPAALRERTALVVLGSGVHPPMAGVPSRERLDGAASARTAGAARWFLRTHPAAVIVSGTAPGPDPRAAAVAMADALEAAGVPRDRVWLEPRATNTRENARYSVALGRARGITRFVVVTSALHMPRSLREFRRAGVEPVAAPVDFVGPRFGGVGDLLPSVGSLGRTDQCLHELLGMLKP